MKNYVQNHNYGYGENNQKINKLNLRNIEDLKDYLNDVLENELDFPFEKKENNFLIEPLGISIDIEEIA